MAQKRSGGNGIIGTIFLWTIAAFLIIGTFVGIKWALDTDFTTTDSGDSLVIPISSEDIISEPSEITSEPDGEQMPAPLLDNVYKDYFPTATRLKLNFEPSKPEAMSASTFKAFDGGVYMSIMNENDYDHLDKRYFYSDIKANSIRYNNNTSNYRLGFSDTTILNETYKEFFSSQTLGNYEPTTYKYVSAFIFDFTLDIKGDMFIDTKDPDLKLYYRNNVNEGWNFFPYNNDGAFEIEYDQLGNNDNVQFAIVMQTNNKSSSSDGLKDLYINFPIN